MRGLSKAIDEDTMSDDVGDGDDPLCGAFADDAAPSRREDAGWEFGRGDDVDVDDDGKGADGDTNKGKSWPEAFTPATIARMMTRATDMRKKYVDIRRRAYINALSVYSQGDGEKVGTVCGASCMVPAVSA